MIVKYSLFTMTIRHLDTVHNLIKDMYNVHYHDRTFDFH